MYDTNGYLGFTFAGRHSNEFGLLVVSDGSRYHQNFYNQFSDSVNEVPGKNGGYYFGTKLSRREFNINCVFDNITSHTMHKIQHWLYPNKVGWLIFDEQPYKRYLVKLSSVPSFNFVPFDNFKKVQDYTFQQEILKGEINLTFYSLEEYGYYNPEYDLPSIKKDELISQQALDSGLIPSNYIRTDIYLPHEEIKNQADNITFSLYNAGNGIALADFYIIVRKEDIQNTPLEIINFDDGIIYRVSDPTEIIKKKNDNIDNIIYYKIEILSSKQEIYVVGLNENKKNITDKINIGACYNHYFPKVYHMKPTDAFIFTQAGNNYYQSESLLYAYSYDEKDLGSSDTFERKNSFENFQQYWNDYTILTKYGTYNINNIISPATIFIDSPDDEVDLIRTRLCYLVYPNKYISNCELISFIAEYEYTYI